MFGFELWFVFSVASAATGGLYIFGTKIAAERNYDVVLMSTASILVSVVLLIIPTYLWSDFGELSLYVLFLAAMVGSTFMLNNTLRHYALQCIDTAIYFPLYKTITPIFAIVSGIFFFNERFTTIEWSGLIASLFVPLLLISRSEKSRQRNLSKGLGLLFAASLIAAIYSFGLKAGVEATDDTWFFALLTDSMLAVSGIIVMLRRKNGVGFLKRIHNSLHYDFILMIIISGLLQFISFTLLIFAFDSGPLGIVYTINSLYILIPIVLSIIFYNEHWNLRKVIAIILSVSALALLK